ncbi:extracellular protein, gamma-D-glutamate-meso-diaminopimelate muropeptidase [Levilactobacillus paucivorans]|uniref:Extracellular protein, gamma-D-glutamate-meso-diaminopimelate muropeptidase n=1 Tax=Levilactobacillus paucivorans TaxID=616990 RepID=A0A0R2L7X7_9LACO|nr:extracellular protein, gamma-D-glutamate-meso-diaminopimelate muropeptidase [Levilactobacillus paucivorans]
MLHFNFKSRQVKSSQSKQTITVKSGDTLWDLAQAYHVSVAQLQAANHLSGDMLSVGQQLTLPTGAAKATSESTTASTSTTQQSQSTAKANAVQAQIVAEQQAAAAKQQKQQAASASQSASGTTSTSSSSSASTEKHTRAAVAETTPVSQSSASQSSQSQTSQASSSVASQSSVSQSSSSQVEQAQSSQQPSQTSQQSRVSQPASASQTQQTTQTGSQNATATSQTKRIKTTTRAAVKKQASQASQSTTTSSSSSSAKTNTNLSSGSVTGLALKLASANIPYVWGGSSLSGMDCSGLVAYVYKNALGVNLPHNTVSQEAFVTKHSVGTAKPGDILFWGNSGATYHDAIYLGNNQFVAAPEPGDNVKVQQISKYFMPSFAGTLK